MNFILTVNTIVVIFGIVAFFLFPKDIKELCDLSKCPFCYGDNFCAEITSNASLDFSSFSKFFFNVFSVKNVYFGLYRVEPIVLKKLISSNEISNMELNDVKCSEDEILKYLSDGTNKNFKLCSGSPKIFLQSVKYKDIKNVCAILHGSIEPIILELFPKEEYWPVPKLFGYCGQTVIVENAGEPLNSIENYDWYQRAYVAYQILVAAHNFTENHKLFRLYLTDISPDNIVVNQKLQIRFVDLENVVIKAKIRSATDVSSVHYSKHFNEENFIFSEELICDNCISDHNIFAVCKVCQTFLFLYSHFISFNIT